MATDMPQSPHSQYENLLRHVDTHGVFKADRTGTGTKSVFGYQMRFDLAQGFPLVTTKKVFLKAIIVELLWFLRGDANVKWLQDNGYDHHGKGSPSTASVASWVLMLPSESYRFTMSGSHVHSHSVS